MSHPVTTALPFREIALVTLVVLAVLVFLAIVSYSPLDASWSYAGSDLRVTNLIGTTGAWSADVVLFALGWVAYLIPLGLLAGGVRIVMARSRPWSWILVCVRVFGFVATLLAASVLARLHLSLPAQLPSGAGGAIGDWLAAVGLPVLNWLGLTLLAVAVLAIGAQATLGFSWLRVFEVTGRSVFKTALKTLDVLEMLVRGSRAMLAWSRHFNDSIQTRTAARRDRRAVRDGPRRIEPPVDQHKTKAPVKRKRPNVIPAPVEPARAAAPTVRDVWRRRFAEHRSARRRKPG